MASRGLILTLTSSGLLTIAPPTSVAAFFVYRVDPALRGLFLELKGLRRPAELLNLRASRNGPDSLIKVHTNGRVTFGEGRSISAEIEATKRAIAEIQRDRKLPRAESDEFADYLVGRIKTLRQIAAGNIRTAGRRSQKPQNGLTLTLSGSGFYLLDKQSRKER